MKTLILNVLQVCVVFLTFAAASHYDDQEWLSYKRLHRKNYQNQAEEKQRYQIYQTNALFIKRYNASKQILGQFSRASSTLPSFTVGLNDFSDLSTAEVRRYKMGFIPTINLRKKRATYAFNGNISLPSSLNFITQGYVTPVKDQGMCGACYAFAATGSIEGQYFKKNNKLVSLSEQEIIDCSKPQGNLGCSGGFVSKSYQYSYTSKGVNEARVYPYTTVESATCKSQNTSKFGFVVNFYSIQYIERMLQEALFLNGPIAVALDAKYDTFRSYKSGIYYEPLCSNQISSLTHTVLLVGYGTDLGVDYWLIKNSWGTSWGIGGYMRFARNRNNHCGIATYGVFPVIQ